MIAKLDDLWPSDIPEEGVLMPRSLLEFQAMSLERRTAGLLRAAVHQLEAEEQIELSFNVIAPVLDYSCRLFSVRHRRDLPYPAVIIPPDSLPSYLQPMIRRKEVVQRGGPMRSPLSFEEREVRELVERNPWLAATEDEYRDKIREVLALPESRGIIQSLLARTNAAKQQSSAGAAESPESPPSE